MGSKILWAIIVGFLAGVLFRSFIPLGLLFASFVLLLAAAAAVLAVVEKEKRLPVQAGAATILAAAALLAFALGITRMHIAVLSGDPALSARIGQVVELEGMVSQEPDARDTTTLVAVKVSALIASTDSTNSPQATIPVRAGVLVMLPAHALVRYGDLVHVSGKLQLPAPFDTGLGRQFNYPQYLAAQGIEYQIGFARISTDGSDIRIFPAGGGSAFGGKAFAIFAKQAYLRGEDAVLPEPEAGLAGGITVGDKRSIGPELTAAFQRDSLVHMIVLSGYNITVVMNFVRWALQFSSRFLQYGAITSVVLFFVLMSGGASSAVRAGAMALIAVFARASGRVYLAGRILGVVAVGMVLYNPFTLAFDPSFQLSALATLGLIAFTPLFAGWLAWLPEKFGLREIASSTLGTQLAVLPLLLYQNGNLSLVALPANLLALAPVPLAMLFSFIAAIGGMLFGSYAVALAAPAYALLWYIITVAKLFAALPFAAVSIPAFSAWWIVATYALMFGGLWVYKKQRPEESPAA